MVDAGGSHDGSHDGGEVPEGPTELGGSEWWETLKCLLTGV